MRSPARPVLLLASLFLCASLPLGAQIPRGPEIEITAADARSEAVTSAAAAANGDFLLVWTEQPPQGPTRVHFRLFRPDGAPRSPELGVGAPPWDQFGGRVAMRADGRFVLVWNERVPGAFRVLGRLFAPNLRALGRPFRLTPELRGNQRDPDVAWTGDAGFVAVWSSDHEGELRRHLPDIYGRRFSAAGRPLGPEFLANAEDAAQDQWRPRVAAAGNGDFVVAWESWHGEGEFYDITLQRFAADGSLRGEPLVFEGKEDTDLDQVDAAVAMAEDGGFLAVCTDELGDFGRHDDGSWEPERFLGIVGRRFAADGTPLSGPVHVNAVAPGRQEHPEVVRRPGGFFAVWDSSESEQRPGGIFARRLRANGTPAAGGDLRISTSGAGQSGPVVAINARARGIVAWTERDGENVHVLARYLHP